MGDISDVMCKGNCKSNCPTCCPEERKPKRSAQMIGWTDKAFVLQERWRVDDINRREADLYEVTLSKVEIQWSADLDKDDLVYRDVRVNAETAKAFARYLGETIVVELGFDLAPPEKRGRRT